MATRTHQLIFISYRRQDSSAASRWLSETLQAAFGASRVFIDIDAIRTGDDWPERINGALRAASVLIAVIGPNWLRLADEHGRRRLDKRDDWVRNEIVYAIRENLLLVPLLVGGASVPVRQSLPRCLMPVLKHQALELRDERWVSDRDLLLARLEEADFRRLTLDRLPSATWAGKQVFAQQLSALKAALALTYRSRNVARTLKQSPGDAVLPGHRDARNILGSYHQAVENLLFEERALLPDKIFRILHDLKSQLRKFIFILDMYRDKPAGHRRSPPPNLNNEVAAAYEGLEQSYEALVQAVQSHIGVVSDQGVSASEAAGAAVPPNTADRADDNRKKRGSRRSSR
ncbi:MAG TPA: toll/interleukin-1 receptor domain-containing protein [Thermoanaerobaculia bacterium]|nr:toll/interleukin-1 receptor domain-containing protein [Thermoanaerobaculia bacterium]